MQLRTSNVVPDAGLSALCRAVAPLEIRVSYTVGPQPFTLAWDGPFGVVRVSGASLEAAASEAHALLLPGSSGGAPVTDPAGETSFAEAMRELIERTRVANDQPRLRLVR